MLASCWASSSTHAAPPAEPPGPGGTHPAAPPEPALATHPALQPPPPLSPLQAYCDMETERGGWTVIQLRANGSLSFQRSWREYKQVCARPERGAAGGHRGAPHAHPPHHPPQGFGDAAGEYWLGNEAVHLLTSQAPYALRVELRDWEGGQVYAHYGRFQLGSERQLYR